MKTQNFLTLAFLASSLASGATKTFPVMAGLERLSALKVPLLYSDKGLGIGVAQVTESQRETLSRMAHERRECGGYRLLSGDVELAAKDVFRTLNLQNARNRTFRASFRTFNVEKKANIVAAVDKVNADNLFEFLKWYSSFYTRYERERVAGMEAVNALKDRLANLTSSIRNRVTVELIQHDRTAQSSIRVRFKGASRPSEIVVLGGHLDSVNWEVNRGRAPGADDNGSGTSNLFELVSILVESQAPQRTVDVFFYAAEETGLIGSGEIANTYRLTNQDVIGVLQIDMSLFPGLGEGVIGLTQDHTSAWLNSYLMELNNTYVGDRFVEDRCEYACSDHASWNDKGYPAVFPFEATMQSYNKEIHTERDAINNSSNFRHSALFSKLAVAFALDLANSSLREQKL